MEYGEQISRVAKGRVQRGEYSTVNPITVAIRHLHYLQTIHHLYYRSPLKDVQSTILYATQFVSLHYTVCVNYNNIKVYYTIPGVYSTVLLYSTLCPCMLLYKIQN